MKDEIYEFIGLSSVFGACYVLFLIIHIVGV